MVLRRLAFGLAAFAAAGSALALEYRSVAPPTAILYDAPSLKAKRLYTVTRLYPLEVISRLEGWAKVRDGAGSLSWIEARHLSDKRTLLVTAATAQVRTAPDGQASVAFQAARDVALELAEEAATARADGWVKVRHVDGLIGYVRLSEVWGE